MISINRRRTGYFENEALCQKFQNIPLTTERMFIFSTIYVTESIAFAVIAERTSIVKCAVQCLIPTGKDN